MTQNSVLSQNWVKCTVCTPMAQAVRMLRAKPAVTWRTRRRVTCHSASPAVSRTVPRAPCRHAPARAATNRVATLPNVSRTSYVVSWRLPQPCHACFTIHPEARPRVRAAALPCAQAGRVMGPLGHIVAKLWPSRGTLLAVSWPLLRAPMRLCHDTMHYIVTKCKNGQ